jgi:hypothetical protein
MLVDAVLDAGEGKVTINLNEDKYTYSFLRASSHPSPPEDEEVEGVGSLCIVKTLRDPLQRAMENQSNDQQDEELEEATKGLEPQDGSVEEEKFEDIGDTKPEETQVAEVDLKPLSKRLKYEFLGPYKTYPVIKHKKVIGYLINDLKGLNPAFCTYHIPLEDQCKPVVDHQRRLTHAMREVVKEVIKLLDARIIYLVPHSVTLVFPKKTKCITICMPISSFMHIVTYK